MGAVKSFEATAAGAETAEEIVAVAAAAAPEHPPARLALADSLAARVAAFISREHEPAILASVTLAIADRGMRIAFLEAVGARLVR